MKSTLQKNLFIALISLGLLSSANADVPKYDIKEIELTFSKMIDEGTGTVEDAYEILIEKGAIDFANFIMTLADKIWKIAEEKEINLDVELTEALSIEIGRTLGAKTEAIFFMGRHAKNKLRMLCELPVIENIFNKVSVKVLHQSLLRRRNKKRIGATTTVTQVKIDENFKYEDESGRHDVHVIGDVVITDTTVAETPVVDDGKVKNHD